MRILLIGQAGQLGSTILDNFGQSHDIHAPGRDKLDVSAPETFEREISAFNPEVIINTAAFHNVAQCESEPAVAYGVNYIAVRNLAIAARRTGAVFVSVSTDYVFNGMQASPYSESDIADPLQIYGMSKLAGEYAALAEYPEGTAIVRTCGLYGRSGARSKGGNFVDKRIRDAATDGPMQMGSDQTVAPTYTDDLSRAVLELVSHEGKARGIFHLVNEGQCTWYEFTRAIYEIAALQKEVLPVDRGGMGDGVRKPLYSVLGNNRAAMLGIRMPHWKDALRRYIASAQADG